MWVANVSLLVTKCCVDSLPSRCRSGTHQAFQNHSERFVNDVELKQSIVSKLQSLEKLRSENGVEEDDWLKQVCKTDGDDLCWLGKDGHFLRCLRSKIQSLEERQMEKEIEALEMFKCIYPTAYPKLPSRYRQVWCRCRLRLPVFSSCGCR